MSFSDIRFAARHLWKNKVYSIVILLSLSIGFSCCHLLTAFLISELNTDAFHTNKDRTFQVFSNDPFGGVGRIAYIPDVMGDYLMNHYPEVENLCRIGNMANSLIETRTGEFNDLQLVSVDSSFFSTFTFRLDQGDARHALGPGSIILSAKQSHIVFGAETPALGKELRIKTRDTTQILTVSGILSETENKSHLQFDALIHHSVLPNNPGGGATYITLNEATAAEKLALKINDDPSRPGLVGAGKMIYTLTRLADSYFNPDNRMPYMKTRSVAFIRVCMVVSSLVFAMAAFNFINLFIMALQARRKQVGIKKTLGAGFPNLIGSSLSEVALYVVASLALSFLMTSYLLPAFNRILDSSVKTGFLFGAGVISVVAASILVLVVIAVVVAALHQWKIGAVSVMRNFSASRSGFSRISFLLQFIVSTTLIISAITIIRQMEFIEKEPLGFNREIIQVHAPSKDHSSKLHALKQALSQTAAINQMTICNGNPISGNSIVRYELESGDFYTPYVFSGDEDFVKTLDLTLLEGELLSAGKGGKLVNETFVRMFGLNQPIGQKIPGTEDRITGVVRDFTCGSFKTRIPPVIIGLEAVGNRMLISYSGRDLSALIGLIKQEWARVFPEDVFVYQIIQDDLMNKYKDERFFYEVIVASSLMSVVISCFGLFALSWAVVESKVREIGIRKVLGATPGDIVGLLTGTFMKRIAIAFAVAAPLAYYLMREWLKRFEYRISVGFEVFLLAAAILLLISMATLALQTRKAAVINPVDELKAQ